MVVFREALNGPNCDAIHATEIETSIECDTFIPAIDSSAFQPWYSSFPSVENKIRYSFATYVRVRGPVVESRNEDDGLTNGVKSGIVSKFEVKSFNFLPKMIFEKHEEYLYLRLVQDIISDGNVKDDRTGTGTLSKFGCQVMLSSPALIYAVKFCGAAINIIIIFSHSDAVQFTKDFPASYNQGM